MLPSRASRRSRFLAALLIGTALTCGGAGYVIPASAQTTTVERLTFGPKEMAVTVPRIDVEGSSLTQGELATLFQFKDVQSIADMLKRFNAKSVRVPEIRVEQSLPAGEGKSTKQITIYRDLALTDVVAGKARSLTVAGGSMELDDSNLGKMSGTIGRVSIDDTDFTAMVRLIVDKAAPGEQPRTVYRNGVFDGMSMKGDKFEMTFGRMTFGEFRARPLKDSLLSIIELGQRMDKSKGSRSNPEDLRRMLDFIVDMFDAFESTPMTLESLRVAATDKEKRPVNVGMGKMTIGGWGKRRYPSISVENVKVDAPDGAVSMASFNFKGLDFSPTAAGLQEVGSQPLEQWAKENWRRLIPNFDGFALAGVNIDVPDNKNKGERIKAKLGDFDLTLRSYVDGVPTDISSRLRNFVFDIPANTKETGLRDILALGYKTLDLSAVVLARWDEGSKTIVFDELSAQSAAMGGVTIKAVIGNAIKELFTGDATMMQIAALGLTAKELEIKVDNAGVFEKLVAQEARKLNKKPEDFRRDMGAMANVIIPGVLGGGEAAQTVANALSAFIARPGKLLVAAKAKDPAGISIGEAAMAGNPLALIPKVDITAKAN